ncbi:spore coat protein GerQ [Alkalihalobacillus sp. MEB130]|uniref:spore coat protein GerQ n=1 Tax=Alkalihalobacillus sp. MEB130 TaxID=2976704 RepID=UPI0028DEA208|nr:spore coat protein GerQ [Alkalihalobacillus sp. MEB130]MDT8861896.1 spore coat protein GerQ [Alkalihalobacillus sp. MEB130]
MYQQPWYPQQQGTTGFGQQQGFPQHQHQQQQQPPTAQPTGQLPYQSAQQYQFQHVPGITQQPQPFPGMTPQQFFAQQEGMLPLEQSFIENILRLNRGKAATFYMTFENNPEWNARVFRGIVEEAGRDHIVVGDFEDQTHYLLLMVNLDYVEFDEPIEYDYPFGQVAPPLATYSPRPNGS